MSKSEARESLKNSMEILGMNRDDPKINVSAVDSFVTQARSNASPEDAEFIDKFGTNLKDSARNITPDNFQGYGITDQLQKDVDEVKKKINNNELDKTKYNDAWDMTDAGVIGGLTAAVLSVIGIKKLIDTARFNKVRELITMLDANADDVFAIASGMYQIKNNSIPSKNKLIDFTKKGIINYTKKTGSFPFKEHDLMDAFYKYT